MECFRFGEVAFGAEGDQVGREEADFVDNPALKPNLGLDVVALRNPGGDTLKGGPGQNLENSVCSMYRGFIERLLRQKPGS